MSSSLLLWILPLFTFLSSFFAFSFFFVVCCFFFFFFAFFLISLYYLSFFLSLYCFFAFFFISLHSLSLFSLYFILLFFALLPFFFAFLSFFLLQFGIMLISTISVKNQNINLKKYSIFFNLFHISYVFLFVFLLLGVYCVKIFYSVSVFVVALVNTFIVYHLIFDLQRIYVLGTFAHIQTPIFFFLFCRSSLDWKKRKADYHDKKWILDNTRGIKHSICQQNTRKKWQMHGLTFLLTICSRENLVVIVYFIFLKDEMSWNMQMKKKVISKSFFFL